MSEGEDRRDAGMASAYANAPLLWKMAVVRWMAQLRRTPGWRGIIFTAPQFTADFYARGGPRPHTENAWGQIGRASCRERV